MTSDILWALPPSAQIRPLAVLKQKEISQLQKYAPDDDGDLFVAHALGTRSPPVLLNEPTIGLLRQFETPSTVLAAVEAFGASRPLEPLPDAAALLSALKKLIAAGLLVRADATNWLATIAPSLRAGDRFGGYEVLRCVHYVGDAEVYEVRELVSGKHYALKRVKNPSPELQEMLARERRALEDLQGTAACRLHQVVREQGEALVLEWIGGAPLAHAVGRMQENGAPRRATLDLAINCVGAVASVHARGFVHGDLHPGNFLIDQAGRVRLVDFGLACRAKRRPKAMPAGGVLAFMAPEHARAVLVAESSPKVASSTLTDIYSLAADIYSLAAVLFFVFTGEPPIELPVGRSGALEAISSAPTRSFRSVGIRRWPAVERALAAALKKDPARRVGSADELSTALKKSVRFASGSSHDIAGLRAELHAYVTRSLTTLDDLSWPEFIRTSAAPHASVAFGGAGIAYAFLRASMQLEDPHLLAKSRQWIGFAHAARNQPDAFLAKPFGLNRSLAPEGSLYHGMAGVHFVATLIASASGDVVAEQRSGRQWLHYSRAPLRRSELLAGAAGRLLGCLQLDAAGAGPSMDTLGAETASKLMRSAGRTSLNGLAHGAAGAFFALMSWARTSENPLPKSFWTRLDGFAARGSTVDGRVAWPTRHGAQPSSYMCSWCNGAPGLALLWTLAYETTTDVRYLELARACGNQSLDRSGSSAPLLWHRRASVRMPGPRARRSPASPRLA